MKLQEMRITVSTGTFFRAALVLIFFWLLYILRDIVLILLTAVVIASAIEPLTLWFVKHKLPRVLSVIVIYAGLIGFFFGLLYLFIPPILNETSGFLTSLPAYVENFEIPNSISQAPFVGGFTQQISLEDSIITIQGYLSSISGNLFQSITVIFGGIFSFLIILILSFYLAVQKRGIQDFLEIITPASHEKYVVDLWERSKKKIGLWMQGQLLLGLIVGVLVYLGLTVIGLEYALLLAVLAAVFELIPLFGSIIAGIPAILLGFIDGPTTGFMVLGLYVIIQQFENHLIYPLVVRKVVGVSPILVILALIIGAKLAGFIGVLLAVPIAAAFMEFTDDIQKGKKHEIDKAKA